METTDPITDPAAAAAQQQQARVQISYQNMTALYAGSVLINSNADEMMMDFSSGAVSNPGSGSFVLPIHTRIAMTRTGASGLLRLLAEKLGVALPADTEA